MPPAEVRPTPAPNGGSTPSAAATPSVPEHDPRPLALAKAELRACLRAAGRARVGARAQAESAAIITAVREHPAWAQAGAVAAFVGVEALGEPDTRPLLAAALAAGKRLWLPHVPPRRAGAPVAPAMTFVAVDSSAGLDALERGALGVVQPAADPGGLAHPPVDLVLVPGLGFDGDGRRLGRGRGYYDRALARSPDLAASPGLCAGAPPQRRPLRVGLAFADAVIPGPIPVEPHDVTMDALACGRGWRWTPAAPAWAPGR